MASAWPFSAASCRAVLLSKMLSAAWTSALGLEEQRDDGQVAILGGQVKGGLVVVPIRCGVGHRLQPRVVNVTTGRVAILGGQVKGGLVVVTIRRGVDIGSSLQQSPNGFHVAIPSGPVQVRYGPDFRGLPCREEQDGRASGMR